MKVKKKRKPEFKRQEVWKYKRLKRSWRIPTGRDSAMKKGYKTRGPVPSMGYKNPDSVRGLAKDGLRFVRVFTVSEIKNIDPKSTKVVIASTVGRRKRFEIIEAAEKAGVKVANRRV